MQFTATVLNILALGFVAVIGAMLAAIVVLFFVDRLQTSDAIRRNYRVIAMQYVAITR